MRPFKWTGQRERAAKLAAEDKLPDEQIAAEVGVTWRALTYWRAHPEFMARVSEIVEQIRAAVLAEGIASKQNRVDALNDRWQRLRRIIDERAADPDMEDVPGGTTGLLVHQVKQVGAGPAAQIIDEYAVDTGLLKESREHEKQAAIELRQWAERKEITGEDGGPIQVEEVRTRILSQLARLPEPEPEGETGSESE